MRNWKTTPYVVLSVRVPAELAKWLESHLLEQHMTKTDFVNDLLLDYASRTTEEE